VGHRARPCPEGGGRCRRGNAETAGRRNRSDAERRRGGALPPPGGPRVRRSPSRRRWPPRDGGTPRERDPAGRHRLAAAGGAGSARGSAGGRRRRFAAADRARQERDPSAEHGSHSRRSSPGVAAREHGRQAVGGSKGYPTTPLKESPQTEVPTRMRTTAPLRRWRMGARATPRPPSSSSAAPVPCGPLRVYRALLCVTLEQKSTVRTLRRAVLV
jgi:hypothetical protein